MKNRILIAVLIFVVGEAIIFSDSRKLECEVTLSGILTDCYAAQDENRFNVGVDGRISAVKSLTYQNAPWRKVKLDDPVTLVLKNGTQYLYYRQISVTAVKIQKFFEDSFYWLFLSAVIGFLLKYFKLTP